MDTYHILLRRPVGVSRPGGVKLSHEGGVFRRYAGIPRDFVYCRGEIEQFRME